MKVVLNICTKNNIDTINYTLNAIIKQTRHPDLVVFVDASMDGTTEVLKDFMNRVSFPVKIIKQKSGGVGKARQLFYEYIKDKDFDLAVFLDTEKIPRNDWLEKHIKYHEKYSEIDIVCGAPMDGCKIIHSPFQDGRYLIQGNCSIKMRALRKVGGWDERFNRGEDWDLALRLFKDAKAICLLCGDVMTESIQKDNIKMYIKKTLNKPLSFDYLSKYGLWYLVNYPQHIIGDLISIIYIIYIIYSILNIVILNNWIPAILGIILHLLLMLGIARYRWLPYSLLAIAPIIYGLSVIKYICNKIFNI